MRPDAQWVVSPIGDPILETQAGSGSTAGRSSPSRARTRSCRRPTSRSRRAAAMPARSAWARATRTGGSLDEARLIRDELDKRIEAFLAKLVPPDDSAAERYRFVLVVWLARTYVVCGHTCPSAEGRREFGIGADDCDSSGSITSSGRRRAPTLTHEAQAQPAHMPC